MKDKKVAAPPAVFSVWDHFPAILVVAIFLILAACTARVVSTPVPPSTSTSVRAASTSTALSPTPSAALTITLAPTATPTPIPQVSLYAVGDIMLGRTVGDQVLAKGPQIVFAGVQSALDSADLLVGNLECAITDRSLSEHKSFTLKAPPETAQALSLAGFDVLSLANNHAMDYGYAGLSDTQASLQKVGVLTVGAGADATAAHAPVILIRSGLKIAFLGYVDVPPENSGFDAHAWIAGDSKPGLAWADPDQIKTDVTAARRSADLVIVLLHDGIEITTVINSLNASQRSAAHAAIDAGASLVIGSHPHVLQQFEKYHGGLVAYSLGNFVFDQYAGIANATIILRVVLDRSGLKSFDYVPALIENGLPHLITNAQVPAIGTLVAPLNP